MPIYKVGFWYTEYCTAQHIEADSAEEAEKWLYDELEQNGTGEIEYRTNDRDYGTNSAEERE